MKRKIIALITMCLMTVCMIPSVCFAATQVSNIEITFTQPDVGSNVLTESDIRATADPGISVTGLSIEKGGNPYSQTTFEAGEYQLAINFTAPQDATFGTAGEKISANVNGTTMDADVTSTGLTVIVPLTLAEGNSDTLAFEKSEYTYTKGSKKDLTLTCNGNLDEFTEFAIAINGSENSTALEKNVDYTVKSGSTVITVKYETLEKMETGQHKALAFYGDNLASATLNVKAADKATATTSDSNPKTGDSSIALPIMVVLMLAAATAGIAVYRKNN